MTAFRSISTLGGILITLFAGTAVHAQEGEWRLSTGVDMSTGDYGGDPVDTDITYVPFTAGYSTGNWNLRATLPWVSIDGPGTVVGAGDGGVVTGGRGNGSTSGPGGSGSGGSTTQVVATSESGLGDVWLSAMYSIDSLPAELFYLDLGVKVKLPTADEDKGLGTGKSDFSLQADLFKPMGNVMPFATIAYKVKGEPDGVKLNNVLFLSAGADFTLSETTHWGLSLDWQEAAIDGVDDSSSLMGYVNHALGERWSVMAYGYSGMTDASPDIGGGLQFSYRTR